MNVLKSGKNHPAFRREIPRLAVPRGHMSGMYCRLSEEVKLSYEH